MVIIAFDIDNCLRSKDTETVNPNEDIRTLMVIFKRIGCHIVLWSGGGVVYAHQVAYALGVSHLIDTFASKTDTTIAPDITIDDEVMTRGQVNIKLPEVA